MTNKNTALILIHNAALDTALFSAKFYVFSFRIFAEMYCHTSICSLVTVCTPPKSMTGEYFSRADILLGKIQKTDFPKILYLLYNELRSTTLNVFQFCSHVFPLALLKLFKHFWKHLDQMASIAGVVSFIAVVVASLIFDNYYADFFENSFKRHLNITILMQQVQCENVNGLISLTHID